MRLDEEWGKTDSLPLWPQAFYAIRLRDSCRYQRHAELNNLIPNVTIFSRLYIMFPVTNTSTES